MKQIMKSFAAGFLACSLLSATVAFATGGVMKEIFYGVNVVVDGKSLEFTDDTRPFTMDGRTFLPVRAISDALGKQAEWDGNTSTVYIGEKSASNVSANRTLLGNLEPFKSNGVSKWTETRSDNWGDKYVSGYYFEPGGRSTVTSATFLLNGKYKTLTATIAPSGGHGDKSSPTVMSFYSLTEINSTKLMETKEISSLTKPYTITVDLSGVDTLMIEAVKSGWEQVAVGLVDAYLE